MIIFKWVWCVLNWSILLDGDYQEQQKYFGFSNNLKE